MNAQPYISPKAQARVEAQQRAIRLAAEAHLATRAVERILRGHVFDSQPLGEVEATVLREHIDQAVNSLASVWQEAEKL